MTPGAVHVDTAGVADAFAGRSLGAVTAAINDRAGSDSGGAWAPGSFAERLRAAEHEASGVDARAVAEQFVAKAFIEPVLAIMRDTNTAAAPFAPNAAERRFTPMLHQHIAERVVRSANFALVERIERHIEGPAAGRTGAGTAAEIAPLEARR